MNKEKLHIFYDTSIQKIKVEIYSQDGSYASSSAWQDILISLIDNNNFKRTCLRESIIVEYSDIIVKIDDWKKCSQSQLIGKYIMRTIAKQQQNRIQTVSKHNESILEHQKSVTIETKSNDDELLPAAITKALKEKHDRAFSELEKQQYIEEKKHIDNNKNSKSLKVKRNNKYHLVVPIITGTLVLGALTGTIFPKENKDISQEQKISIETSTIDPAIVSLTNPEIDNNDNFQIGLDINDLVQTSNISINYSNDVSLKYEDRSKEDKVIETKIKYGDLIDKYAKKCGIDPKIVLGIATQESGDHELGLRSGSNGGLMQIEISYWKGKEISYYDFDDKESYIIKIDDNINDVENNILIGCAILQNELKTYNYNTLLAIQGYNMGYSNMNKILDATSAQSGLTKTQIINDEKYLDWLNYTGIVNQGDPNYVNNVLSWTGFGYDFYELSCKKESGDVKICTTLPMEPINAKAI